MWLILTVPSVGDLLLLGKFKATQEKVEEKMEKGWGDGSVSNLKSGKSGVQ